MVKKNSAAENESEAFFETYKYHANTLRTWFIAYGIGLPALFVSITTFLIY
jgi:hypothetical protein